MSVTREVSQVEMSALKFCKDEKSFFMLVTFETSQSAMGPYDAMAVVELASYSRTAVFRAALFVKTLMTRRRWYVGAGAPAPRSPCRGLAAGRCIPYGGGCVPIAAVAPAPKAATPARRTKIATPPRRMSVEKLILGPPCHDKHGSM